jgi:hypothetical protein
MAQEPLQGGQGNPLLDRRDQEDGAQHVGGDRPANARI